MSTKSFKTRVYPMSPEMEPKLSVRMGSTTVSLAPSDIPVQFSVTTCAHDNDDVELCLRFEYLHATGELLEYSKHGRAEVGVGKFSQRLFEVRLVLPPEMFSKGESMTRATAELTRNLMAAFRELKLRSRFDHAKMNIGAASAGLDIEYGDSPPAWMIDAFRAFRERSSGAGPSSR